MTAEAGGHHPSHLKHAAFKALVRHRIGTARSVALGVGCHLERSAMSARGVRGVRVRRVRGVRGSQAPEDESLRREDERLRGASKFEGWEPGHRH